MDGTLVIADVASSLEAVYRADLEGETGAAFLRSEVRGKVEREAEECLRVRGMVSRCESGRDRRPRAQRSTPDDIARADHVTRSARFGHAGRTRLPLWEPVEVGIDGPNVGRRRLDPDVVLQDGHERPFRPAGCAAIDRPIDRVCARQKIPVRRAARRRTVRARSTVDA